MRLTLDHRAHDDRAGDLIKGEVDLGTNGWGRPASRLFLGLPSRWSNLVFPVSTCRDGTANPERTYSLMFTGAPGESLVLAFSRPSACGAAFARRRLLDWVPTSWRRFLLRRSSLARGTSKLDQLALCLPVRRFSAAISLSTKMPRSRLTSLIPEESPSQGITGLKNRAGQLDRRSSMTIVQRPQEARVTFDLVVER